MVQDTSGRAHHHMRAMLQALGLSAQCHTATQGNDFHIANRTRQTANFLGDLFCQFACGAQHQGLCVLHGGVKFFNQRQSKCSGFATACAGLRDHIAACQRDMQTGSLDGGHLGVTQLRQIGMGCRAKRQGIKA